MYHFVPLHLAGPPSSPFLVATRKAPTQALCNMDMLLFQQGLTSPKLICWGGTCCESGADLFGGVFFGRVRDACDASSTVRRRSTNYSDRPDVTLEAQETVEVAIRTCHVILLGAWHMAPVHKRRRWQGQDSVGQGRNAVGQVIRSEHPIHPIHRSGHRPQVAASGPSNECSPRPRWRDAQIRLRLDTFWAPRGHTVQTL